MDASLLKKNEFALIILGALLLTIIIFFVFFRSSDSGNEPFKKTTSNNATIIDLEKRIKTIEQALQLKEEESGLKNNSTADQSSMTDSVRDRVARLETAFSVKFDSVLERMGKIENSISELKNRPVSTVAAKPAASIVSPPVKKAVKKEKKAPMFHTVKKGDTLYSISKKYNTSIAALRKLNHLSTTAKIYPGNNILIR